MPTSTFSIGPLFSYMLEPIIYGCAQNLATRSNHDLGNLASPNLDTKPTPKRHPWGLMEDELRDSCYCQSLIKLNLDQLIKIYMILDNFMSYWDIRYRMRNLDIDTGQI